MAQMHDGMVQRNDSGQKNKVIKEKTNAPVARPLFLGPSF